MLSLSSNLVSNSESTDSLKTKFKLPVETHRWSLQFGIWRNLDLTSFQGTNLSMSYLFNSRTILRFGLSLIINNSNSEDHSVYDRDFIRKTDKEIDDSRTTIDFRIQVVRSLKLSKTSFYCGLGPMYQYTRDNAKENEIEILSDTSQIRALRDYEINISSYGITSLVGIEWFVNAKIGIHAEYSTSINYFKSDFDDTRFTEYQDGRNETLIRSGKSDGFELRGESVKFGLSVYF